MAKSTTKNVLTEIDLEKIRRFTDNELAKLSKNSDLPFCYQIGADIVVVGAYKVLKIDDKTWQVLQKDQQLFDFFTRKDAIFYCIALHKKDHKLASSIQTNDQQLAKLEADAILYRYRYKKAQETNNEWEIELYSNRYAETMARIEQVKKELKKNINLAKYIKV
jgi:hypothetical protein